MKRYCPACDAETQHAHVFDKAGFGIFRCQGCGLGSTLLPADFDPLKIYGEEFFQGGQRHGYADYAASERVLRREFAESVRFLRKYGVESGRLLEIGCAYGFFLSEAQRHFQVRGLEVSEHAVQAAQARGLDVAHRNLAQHFELHPEPVDAVVMLDVVEHLDEPAAMMRTVHEHLNPGGVVMLTTGDWSSLSSKLMGKRWRLMTPPEHLYFFSPATLSRMLEKIGFEVVKIVKPWKKVPVGLMAYQIGARCGIRWRALESVQSIGVPVNLFDAFRLLARKRGSGGN
jgi:2-polyprenyl-3-methyl-5-hydroxy-6-metoxy-1,4-benzoquinol methylase